MTDVKTFLGSCASDRSAFDSAMGSGDFSLAREKALDLEACALGMGDEALVAKAKELGALAAGNVAGKIFEKTSGEKSKQPAAAFLAQFSETLLNVYGDRSNWPVEVKQSLAKLSAARGSSAFATEAAKVLNELRLSPETYPAFEIGEALLANHGGEFFAAAKSLEALASRGIIGDKTLSFAYDFIFGNPENTLLPLYAAGRLGKLVEGLTAIGAETLGLTKVATQAFRVTTGLATEAPVFVGAGKLVALGKGKPVDLNAGTFFKESFSSGLVFGALKLAGFFAQTVNAFLPATEAGKAAAFWNANLTSVAALMGVGGAERLVAGEHAENKPLFDAFVEACVVHFGISAMMGSVSLNNVGREFGRIKEFSVENARSLFQLFFPDLVAEGVGQMKALTSGAGVDAPLPVVKTNVKPMSPEVREIVEKRLYAAALREISGLIDAGVVSAPDADAIVSSSIGRRLGVIGPFTTADVGRNGITFKNISEYLFGELFNNSSAGEFVDRLIAGANAVYGESSSSQTFFDATPAELGSFKKAAVLGTGTMSAGIILELALGGMEVIIRGRDQGRLDASFKRFCDALELHLSKGLISQNEYDLAKGRVRTTLSLKEAVAEADLVVETVEEDLDVKRMLFVEVEKYSKKKDAIFATNTSGFALSKIVDLMRDSSRAVVLHFWNPAHLLPLVEVVGTTPESPAARLAGSLMAQFGKKPVLLKKETVGHVGNRIQFALFREANAIVEEGLATCADVDLVVTTGFGKDLAQSGFIGAGIMRGVDFIKASAEMFFKLSNSTEPPKTLVQNVANNRIGMESGGGFFDWAEAAKAAVLASRDEVLYRHKREDLKKLPFYSTPQFDAKNDPFLNGRTRFGMSEWFKMLTAVKAYWLESGMIVVSPSGVEKNLLWAQVMGKSYFFLLNSSALTAEVVAVVDVWQRFSNTEVNVYSIGKEGLIDVKYEQLLSMDVQARGGAVVEMELPKMDCVGWAAKELGLNIDTQGLHPNMPTFHMFMNRLEEAASPIAMHQVRVGDIVLYGSMQPHEYGSSETSFNPSHVGVVTRLDGQNIIVRSKWGLGQVYDTPLEVNLAEWGDKVVFMRLKDAPAEASTSKTNLSQSAETIFGEMFAQSEAQRTLRDSCKLELNQIVELFKDSSPVAREQGLKKLYNYFINISYEFVSVGRGDLQAEWLRQNNGEATSQRVADFIRVVENTPELKEAILNEPEFERSYNDAKRGFDNFHLHVVSARSASPNPVERYDVPVTYGVEQLREALKNAKSIQDFVRTLEVTCAKNVELDGRSFSGGELAAVARHVIYGKKIHNAYELGWFGDVLSEALLDLVNIQRLFPDIYEKEALPMLIGPDLINDYNHRFNRHAQGYFKLFTQVVPPEMSFAEGTLRLNKLSSDLSKLDALSPSYPTEVINSLRESGLRFEGLINDVMLVMAGVVPAESLGRSVGIELDPFGLGKNLEKHLERGRRPDMFVDIVGVNDDATSVSGELRAGERGNWFEEAMRLQWAVRAARSVEELISALENSRLEVVMTANGSFGSLNDALALSVEAARIRGIRNGTEKELPDSELLGVKAKLAELMQSSMPTEIGDIIFGKMPAREKARAIMDLFFSEASSLKKYLANVYSAQEKNGKGLEDLWDTVRRVVSGNGVLNEVPRAGFFRLNLERLMTAFVDSVKEVHEANSKKIWSKHNPHSEWPTTASMEILRGMIGIEDFSAFAIWYLRGQHRAAGEFVFPSVARDTIGLVSKYFKVDSSKIGYDGARAMLVSKLFSREGLTGNPFWENATRGELNTAVLAFFNGATVKGIDFNDGRLFLEKAAKLGFHREMLLAIEPDVFDGSALVFVAGPVSCRQFVDRYETYAHTHPATPPEDPHRTFFPDGSRFFENDPTSVMPSVYQRYEENFTGDIHVIKQQAELFLKRPLHMRRESVIYHHGYFWNVIFSPYGRTVYRYQHSQNGASKVKIFVAYDKGQASRSADIKYLEDVYFEIMQKEGDLINVELSFEFIEQGAMDGFFGTSIKNTPAIFIKP